MKIAIIWWTDTCIHGDQQSVTADDDLKPIAGISCGLLVKQDYDGVTVSLDSFTDRTYRNAVTYSRKQIQKCLILEVKE
jgi:hypothetical protein